MEFELNDAVAVLERTPRVLRALLSGLPDAWIHGHEGEGTWSPFDVVGHLIHGEKTDWVPRAEIILREGEARPFQPFDRFAHLAANRDRSLEDLLDELARCRTESLARLRELVGPEADLDRRGRHPELGSVTLRELLATWVAHDLGHLAQIVRVMAKQYADAVGPWRVYLGILSR